MPHPAIQTEAHDQSQPPLESLAAAALPLAGGLFLTGLIAALFCQIPTTASLSWRQLLVIALAYLLTAALAHTFAVWAICRGLRDHIQSALTPILLATWLSSAWLPLLALLTREHSPWAALVPAVIAGNATLFLKRSTATPVPPISARTQSLFHVDEPPPIARALLPAVLAAFAFQSAAVAFLLHRTLTAGVLLALGVAIPLALYPIQRKRRPAVVFLTVNVFLFTAMALTPFLMRGVLGRRAAALLQLKPAIQPAPPPDSAYTGVILHLPPKPLQRITPPPPATHASATGQAKPIVIPFDGVYWYFKRPDTRPRPTARTVQADPSKANIRSTDFLPLEMEAHQTLALPIKLDCCTALHVDIRNADTRAGTIALEILLKRTGTPGATSLGVVPLHSSEGSISLTRPPVDETIAFPIPRVLHGNQIDEIVVVVRTARERSRAGAQIAVQQFVLVP